MASYRYHRAPVADGDSAVRDKDRHIPKCRRSIILASVLACSAPSWVTYRGILLLVPSYSHIWGQFGARCGRISYQEFEQDLHQFLVRIDREGPRVRFNVINRRGAIRRATFGSFRVN
jgi:hypothetical protein